MKADLLKYVYDVVQFRTLSGDLDIWNIVHDFAVIVGSLFVGALVYIAVVCFWPTIHSITTSSVLLYKRVRQNLRLLPGNRQIL
jgi:hypothetical protein